MKLTVVGCAGSYAGPESAASCYLVQASDESGRVWNLILDLGSGSFGSLQRHIEPSELDAVAISHMHADHIADITGLEVYRKYHPERAERIGAGPADRAEALTVLGPSGIARRVARLSASEDESSATPAGALTGEPCTFRFVEWETATTYRIGPFTIEAFDAHHPIEAYSIRISGPSDSGAAEPVVLAFSGDTDDCAGVRAAASGADLFLCEAAFVSGRDDAIDGVHLTGQRAGRIATDAGVRQLALTHIPAWNAPGIARDEARVEYAGPLSVVRPGDTFVL
ncbi:MBL fold metallo-hydrolase [Rarobacter faecitabidus]|uniref:Ribonuclease BN (tRNA processing enzyme) n=1 Tax=Rarobacter faecitabidus TaxID=13243 RepID=A0A542ZWS0_RARFA|nr:MBL fold metallo-hydrolase [Rarobacter faecitabidus]TQL64801.1 ribonuclease BN (tRNA processing enzyme) [Rarobacter faecitabidus]